MTNLFSLPDPLPPEEQFDDLISAHGVKIERIVSTGQVTPEGEWYDQERDEWVVLIQGKATLEYDNKKSVQLSPGDHILIPAHQKHRVSYTSADPPCIWLAVHGVLT
ncbi:MAG: cupin domain-containing protein [Candidatus Latescibacteria bacterium]|jgi:cupin 2 domain-containing protein|nr:cupin domain-containing protein [Candidatus Latescibacterota bacterium]